MQHVQGRCGKRLAQAIYVPIGLDLDSGLIWLPVWLNRANVTFDRPSIG
jgi:hypothetical protein